MHKLTFNQLQARHERPSSHLRMPISVLLDDIRSLHNVGAVFRTADGAALEHIYLCGISGTPPRSEIRKTSLGAEDAVAWSYHHDPLEVVNRLRAQGTQIVLLEQTSTSVDYRHAEYRFPLCLILGHEYNGVRDELAADADLAVEIPMCGVKHSLNVSVAFGVAIYAIRNRWEEKHG